MNDTGSKTISSSGDCTELGTSKEPCLKVWKQACNRYPCLSSGLWRISYVNQEHLFSINTDDSHRNQTCSSSRITAQSSLHPGLLHLLICCSNAGSVLSFPFVDTPSSNVMKKYFRHTLGAIMMFCPSERLLKKIRKVWSYTFTLDDIYWILFFDISGSILRPRLASYLPWALRCHGYGIKVHEQRLCFSNRNADRLSLVSLFVSFAI